MPINHIGDFILETNYENLSMKTKEIIKKAFIDTIAVTIAAENKKLSLILREINEKKFSESYNSTVVTALKSNPSEFAFLFGTMSHILDYDDVNFTFYGHPSVTLIPTILALSKEKNLSGKKMIEAYAIGFEVQAKIGESMGKEQYQMGWHTTSTIGIYGAIAAASKLLSFDEKQIKSAIGLASSFASGIRKNFGTMTKPIHVGLVAKNALTISEMVEYGVTSNENIFSPPLSIDLITTNQSVDFSPLRRLGIDWEIEQNEIIFKKYPCCAFTHRSIDATLDMVKKYEIHHNDVEIIEALVHPIVPKVLIYEKPKSITEAQFSLYYCLAASIIDKKINLSTFAEQKIKRRFVRALMDKIQVKVDASQKDEAVEKFSTISINANGKKYESVIHFPKGHPENPLTEDEFLYKFHDCLKVLYTSEVRNSLYESLSHLEKRRYKDIEWLLLQVR